MNKLCIESNKASQLVAFHFIPNNPMSLAFPKLWNVLKQRRNNLTVIKIACEKDKQDIISKNKQSKQIELIPTW